MIIVVSFEKLFILAKQASKYWTEGLSAPSAWEMKISLKSVTLVIPRWAVLLINKNTKIQEQQQIYVDLMNSNKIYDFANSKENISEAEISAFAEELYKDYPLEKTVLRRLIRIYSINGEIFYDLDYDTQLQRAIEIVNSKDFYNLLENTKTLLEIEEEKALEEAAKELSEEAEKK